MRLAAGFIGVIQEDDEMATELVEALAGDDRDPLEPYLCHSLRLAAECLADDVRVAPREADGIVAKVCERIAAIGAWPVVESLVKALAAMRVLVPGQGSVAALIRLLEHERWQVRMEATRMLGRAARRLPEIADRLRGVLDHDHDNDDDVKAHAALGIWHAGQRGEDVLKWIQHGARSPYASMNFVPGRELLEAIIKLLQHEAPDVQARAASTLAQWGYQTEATPTLLALLQQENPLAQSRAAEALGRWEPQQEAIPALLNLLKHENPSIQYRAADTLGRWEHQLEATPALLELLEHENPYYQYRAAKIFRSWQPQAKATLALLELLEHENPSVQLLAAEILGTWGQQDKATPTLLKLLHHEDPFVRSSAASVLGQWRRHAKAMLALLKLLQHENTSLQFRVVAVLEEWGHQAEAIPALLKLLRHEDLSVRLRAATALGRWQHQAKAMPVLLELLQDEDSGVRRRAILVLEKYGGTDGSAEALLPLLISTAESIIAYLESAGRHEARPPTSAITHLLAEAIEPAEDDPTHVKAMRQIVHVWAWRASQRGD